VRFITKVLLLASLAATFTQAQTPPTFQHIIGIIQENRTPDNLFGSNPTFVPGVDLATAPGAVQWCLGACFDPNHTNASWQTLYDGGKMDGGLPHNVFERLRFSPGSPATTCNGEIVNDGLALPACPQESYVSGTYDGSKVAPYFDIATKYGFANYFFQTNQGPSMPAHQFSFHGDVVSYRRTAC